MSYGTHLNAPVTQAGTARSSHAGRSPVPPFRPEYRTEMQTHAGLSRMAVPVYRPPQFLAWGFGRFALPIGIWRR